MNPAGDNEHQQGTDEGSDYNRPELGGDDVEIKHQRYAGRYKEEAEVGNQEVGHTLHPVQFYPAQLQKQGEQQHSDDAGGLFDTGKINDQFTQGQASEEDGTLTNHRTIYLVSLKIGCKGTHSLYWLSCLGDVLDINHVKGYLIGFG